MIGNNKLYFKDLNIYTIKQIILMLNILQLN
jgi:hypothetical protein